MRFPRRRSAGLPEPSSDAFLALVCASSDFTFRASPQTGRVTFGSPGGSFLGRSPDLLRQLEVGALRGLVHPGDRALVAAQDRAIGQLSPGQVLESRFRARHADGSWRWVSRRLTVARTLPHGGIPSGGRGLEVIGVARDITAEVEAETPDTDPLFEEVTGLPNRRLLLDRLEQARSSARHEQRAFAVLSCDLDEFSRINEQWGREVGDSVLREVTARLNAVVRDDDTLACLGADQFVIVVSPWNRGRAPEGAQGEVPGGPRSTEEPDPADSASQEWVLRLAERVLASLRRPFEAGDSRCGLTGSVGLVWDDGTSQRRSGTRLIDDADAALHRAKRLGGDRYEVYDDTLRLQLEERQRIERSLRAALGVSGAVIPSPRPAQASRFWAVYQPVVGPSGTVGYEALARLADDRGTRLPVDAVISVAEETGLIHALGARMLDLGCAELARQRGCSSGRLTMAVNVSAHQVHDPRFLDLVHQTLDRHELQPQDLVLELTESALIHATPTTLAALNELRASGVGVCIDDFGTGYASLRYLAALPINGVKVDQSFTHGIPGDPVKAKIVSAVIALADDLGLVCVVEGIETRAQADALPDHVHRQGYLYGRPSSDPQPAHTAAP